MSEFRANITAVLDTSGVAAKIKEIENQRVTLSNIKFNSASLISSIQNALNGANFKINTTGIATQMQSAGRTAGNVLQREISSSLNKIGLTNGGIGNVERMLQGAGFDKKSIATVTDSLNKMSLTIEKIKTTQMSNGNIRMQISGVDELGRAVSILREFDKETGNVINSSKSFTQNFSVRVKQATSEAEKEAQKLQRISQQAAAIKIKVDTGDVETKFNSITQKINSLSSSTPQLQANLKSLTDAFNTLNNPNTSPEGMVAAYQQFKSLLPTITNQVNELAAAERQQAQAAKETAKASLEMEKAQKKIADIQTWMNKNPKAAESFRTELDSIISRLNTVGTEGGANLSQLSVEFARIQSQAKLAGLTTNSFVSSIKTLGLQVLGLGSTYQIAMRVVNAVKSGVNTVVDLDTALIDLKKTTTMSSNDLASFYKDANKEARNLGVSTEEIISQAASWSRLGYGSKHDATTMARLSSQFAMISPGMTVEESTNSLVSTMKAFGVTTDQVLDGVMSKINVVGNHFALSNADIADALQVSSSALAAANNSFEQTVALIAAGTEITQDANRVGMIVAQTYSNVWCYQMVA